MAYDFLDHLQPVGTARYALLEDIYIKGGFKVVRDETERDNLDGSTLKRGMLVKCVESGITWRAENVNVVYDDFGDEELSVDWVEFKFSSKASDSLIKPVELYKVSHASYTMSIAQLGPNNALQLTLDLGCFALMMFNFRVNLPCRVELHSREDYKDSNPYTFKARYNHLTDTGMSSVSLRDVHQFDLKTGAYNILCNEDDKLSHNFYLKVLKDLSLTAGGVYNGPQLLTIAFDYIPIEI